jgi:hypothetical protein
MKMGLGTSLFLIAAGAVLRFAVTVSNDSVNLQTVGVILMVVGAIGVILSLIFWDSWGGWRGRTIVEREPGTVVRRTTVRDDIY